MARVSKVKIYCDVPGCDNSMPGDAETLDEILLHTRSRSKPKETIDFDLCKKHAGEIKKVLKGNL